MPVDPSRPEEGGRKLSRGGFASYDDADVELTLLRADLIRGVAKPIGRDTFGAYAQRWVDGYGGRSGTRLYIQRTIDAMEPYIGHLRLTEIRATDLAAAYRGLENGTKQIPSAKRPRKGLATSTVARYANWVNTIFLAAQDEGLIVKNPANSKHAGRPKGPTSRRVKPFSIWDVDELARFCDWALAEEEPWARAWVILVRTGLRSGELLGLRWGDLDFTKSEMRIERALHCDETLPLGERFVIGPVKGGRPRTVTFDKTCSLLLQEWRKVLPQVLAGATGNVTPLRGLRSADPVFPSLPGRTATQPALMHSFLRVDPAVFLAQSITSWDYVDRYSPTGTGELPHGVSVWRDSDERIVAAVYVYENGFEWCHRPALDVQPPGDRAELASLPGREYFSLFDDEKTMIVGPLEYARAFLRAVVATGLCEPNGLTSYSWPDQVSQVVSTWPPLDMEYRSAL